MSDATILQFPFRPRVVGADEVLFDSPAGPAGGAASDPSIGAGLDAAREADARADALVAQITRDLLRQDRSSQEAIAYALMQKAAQIEAVSPLLRQFARELIPLKQSDAARTLFRMADALETLSAAIEPHDGDTP